MRKCGYTGALYAFESRNVELPLQKLQSAALTYSTGIKESCSQAGRGRSPQHIQVTAFSFQLGLLQPFKNLCKPFFSFSFRNDTTFLSAFQHVKLVHSRKLVPTALIRRNFCDIVRDGFPPPDHAYQS